MSAKFININVNSCIKNRAGVYFDTVVQNCFNSWGERKTKLWQKTLQNNKKLLTVINDFWQIHLNRLCSSSISVQAILFLKKKNYLTHTLHQTVNTSNHKQRSSHTLTQLNIQRWQFSESNFNESNDARSSSALYDLQSSPCCTPFYQKSFKWVAFSQNGSKSWNQNWPNFLPQ